MTSTVQEGKLISSTRRGIASAQAESTRDSPAGQGTHSGAEDREIVRAVLDAFEPRLRPRVRRGGDRPAPLQQEIDELIGAPPGKGLGDVRRGRTAATKRGPRVALSSSRG